jgi:ribulose-phosphate 3-epimerase
LQHPAITVAPSLLSSDFADLKNQIRLAEEGGADWIHLDVMDGHFVPNLTIGPPVIASIRKVTRVPLDVHLMITNAERYLDVYRSAGADVLTVHYEACRHLHRAVQHIKELGAKAGVSLNPSTPVTVLQDILGELDMVLVMTVNPGFGGQSFIPRSLERIRRLAEMIRDVKAAVMIEVDGGIDASTVQDVVSAGATVLVAGNFIFSSPDIPGAVRTLRARAEDALRARATRTV